MQTDKRLSPKQNEILRQLKANKWSRAATARAMSCGERDIYRCVTRLKQLGYEIESNPVANNKHGRNGRVDKVKAYNS